MIWKNSELISKNASQLIYGLHSTFSGIVKRWSHLCLFGSYHFVVRNPAFAGVAELPRIGFPVLGPENNETFN